MTAIQSLKELAYKITGKTPKSNTENGVITEFANDYGNGSSGLFFFNIAYNTVQGGFIADKTFAEIKNAINAKKVAVGMSGAMAIYVTDSGTAGPSWVILDGASGGEVFLMHKGHQMIIHFFLGHSPNIQLNTSILHGILVQENIQVMPQ